MNILFLLGNGFDLNLGMKTSYRDFYENAYQIQSDDNDLIKELKSEIKENIENWADLELAIGKHTSKLKNREEFDIVFDDIREKLADYISQQESSLTFDTSIKNKFLRDMRYPHNFLPDGEKSIFEHTIHNRASVNVISFNYTHSLKKIINYYNTNLLIDIGKGHSSDFFTGIEHIHGFTNDELVLGVDNVEQIDNESFRTDEEVLNSLVKPQLNTLIQHHRDVRCKKLIDNAQIICLFGLSIGETDKTWWEYIGNRLQAGNTKLIIFWWDENKLIHIDKVLREKKAVKERFLSMMSLADNNVKEQLLQSTYVAYNSEIFKIKK